MAFPDVLLGLRALFLESPERPDREALLASEAPGLTRDERSALVGIPAERLDVYVGMLRTNQSNMLAFVAPSTLEVVEKLGGATKAEFARATLVETPRRTSRLRELSQRVVDHLEGAGRALVERCPALLDLARLERESLETFYALDDEGAFRPPEFAAAVSAATVEEVLALRWRPAASLRFATFHFDVLSWRARRFEVGTWSEAPARLEASFEAAVARDPGDLQAAWHRLDPTALALLRSNPTHDPAPLEGLAGAWIEATGVSPDDPEAPARFFEALAGWVGAGLVAVYPAVPLP